MITKYADDVAVVSGTSGILFGVSITNITEVLGLIVMIISGLSALIGLCCKIWSHFKKADINGDGKVDVTEFINALKSLDIKESAKDLREKVKDIQDKIKENDNGN